MGGTPTRSFVEGSEPTTKMVDRETSRENHYLAARSAPGGAKFFAHTEPTLTHLQSCQSGEGRSPKYNAAR